MARRKLANLPALGGATIGVALALILFLPAGKVKEAGETPPPRTRTTGIRTDPIDVRLAAETASKAGARLRIIDSSTGKLVPRAELRFMRSASWGMREEDTFAAATAENGVADLLEEQLRDASAIAAGSGHPILFVTADQYASAVFPKEWVLAFLTGGRGATTELSLIPEMTIEGRVTDPWGRGIHDAHVFAGGDFATDLLADPEFRRGPRIPQGNTAARSDEQGHFILRGIAEFPVDVTAISFGHGLCWPPTTAVAALKPTLVLPPLAVMGLRVSDIESDVALQAASVVVRGQPVGLMGYQETARSRALGGQRRWMLPVPGEYWSIYSATDSMTAKEWASAHLDVQVGVQAPGYEGQEVTVRLRRAVEAGADQPVDIALRRLPQERIGKVRLSVRGIGMPSTRMVSVAVSKDGSPAEAGVVHRLLLTKDEIQFPMEVGSYVVRLISDASVPVSSVRGEDRPSANVYVQTGAESEVNLRDEAPVASIRVTTPTGEKLPGAVIDMYRTPRGALLGMVSMLEIQQSPVYGAVRERHGVLPGSFVSTLRPGTYMAVAKHPGFDPGVKHFEVRRGSPVDVEITLVEFRR